MKGNKILGSEIVSSKDANSVNIIKYKRNGMERKDYTFYKSDEELREGAEYIVEQSKLMKEQCEKYNIKYYETAHDRDKVIQKLLDEQIEGSLRGKKDGISHENPLNREKRKSLREQGVPEIFTGDSI